MRTGQFTAKCAAAILFSAGMDQPLLPFLAPLLPHPPSRSSAGEAFHSQTGALDDGDLQEKSPPLVPMAGQTGPRHEVNSASSDGCLDVAR